MECICSPETWMCRATAYELLSLAFLLPQRDTADALSSGEFAAACAEVGEALGCDEDLTSKVDLLLACYEGKEAESVFHEIRSEYTYLYVGEKLPRITPFAGVWSAEQRGQQGLLFVGKDSMNVERFMRRCGVAKDLEAGQSNDPLDHMGTMCEFLKFLCLVNAQAVQVPQGAVVNTDDFDAFRTEHFDAFAAWFADRTEELARVPFYQAMARFLKAVVG